MNEKLYVCKVCGFAYKKKSWARKCQDYCTEHQTCSSEITSNAVAQRWPSKEYETVRIALLKYYNSKCNTHSGFFISILVGLALMISRYDAFLTSLTPLIFWVVIFLLGLGLIYAVYGTFYWAKLANRVLHTSPITPLNVPLERLNLLLVLHNATHNGVLKESSLIHFVYYGTRKLKKNIVGEPLQRVISLYTRSRKASKH